MRGVLIAKLPLDDITDGTDAVEQGTLIALLTKHRTDLIVSTEATPEDDDD